jgi:hypothetical protein
MAELRTECGLVQKKRTECGFGARSSVMHLKYKFRSVLCRLRRSSLCSHVSTTILNLVAIHANKNFGWPFFMEVLMLACWNIWLVRIGEKIGQNRKRDPTS